MADPRATARRFRAEAGVPQDVPVSAELLLPRLYPVTVVPLPGLCVAMLREWLERHGVSAPNLVQCRDRQLRGAIVAWKGHGLLCADVEDGELERRFTFAHEAGHYLQDHCYPRQDLLARYGEELAPVLDGLRPATAAEQVQAALGRTQFRLYTHLLERGTYDTGNGDLVVETEDGADAFACEVLAPEAALLRRCPSLREDADSHAQVLEVLTREFGLPPLPAGRYAARLVARHGAPVTLVHRLRLV